MSKYIVEMDDDSVCEFRFHSEDYNSGKLGEYICTRVDRYQCCEGNLKSRPEWCDLEKLESYPTKVQNHPFIIGEEL
jgi:hypothetical protein